MLQGGLGYMPVALAAQHSCAAAVDGQAFCAGQAFYGELGFGSPTAMSTTPQPVFRPPGVFFTSTTVGTHHSCATATGGDAYCWGENGQGKLGTGFPLGYAGSPELVKR